MPREWLIQHRAGTLAEWAAAETAGPVLLAGERAYITDLNLDVVGDGVTKVASLGAVGSGTYVRTVNGTGPDGAGNVTVAGSSLGGGSGGGTAATLGTLTPITGRVPAEYYSGRYGFYMQLTSTPSGSSAISYAAPDSGVLSELAAVLTTAAAGRTIRLYVMRLVSGNYQVAYDSGVIAAATAGTVTHTPASSFAIQAGDLPAIWTSVTTNADGLRISESGGNDIGHAKWAPSAAAPSIGATVSGALDRITDAGALRMTVGVAAGSVAFDVAGGVPLLDSAARIKASARPTVDSFWAGKKIVHLGTSIPATANSYAFQAPAMLGATLDNQSVGSSGIVWDGVRALSLGATQAQLTGAGFDPAQSYQSRVIGKAADLYIFDHGYNDRTLALGTITDSTAATFYGAYNVVLDALLAEKPNAQIMMITPHSLYSPSNEGYHAATENIRTAMLAIAVKYAIPVLDFTRIMQLGQAQANYYLAAGANVHPNQEWHDIAGRRLYRFIRDL